MREKQCARVFVSSRSDESGARPTREPPRPGEQTAQTRDRSSLALAARGRTYCLAFRPREHRAARTLGVDPRALPLPARPSGLAAVRGGRAVARRRRVPGACTHQRVQRWCARRRAPTSARSLAICAHRCTPHATSPCYAHTPRRPAARAPPFCRNSSRPRRCSTWVRRRDWRAVT